MDTVTTILAWWGAIVSTAVFVWDVYKWRKTGRPKLIVKASGNMVTAGLNPPQKYISIKVVNVGDKPTTLGLITYRYYKTKPRNIRKARADGRGLFRPGNESAPLPFKLEVGAEWQGFIYQNEEIERMAKEGYLFIEAEDASSESALDHSRTRLLLD